MIDKQRALELLGSGLGPSDVGTTLGCDPSYISQLLVDEEFRRQVLEQRMIHLHAATERDHRIDSLEDEVLQKVADMLPFVVRPREILQCFALLNAAKRRGAKAVGAPVDGQQKIVAIVLPIIARESFLPRTNANGEVVQVGDQVTVTMPLQSLMQGRIPKPSRLGDTYEQTAAVPASAAAGGEKR